MVASRPSRNGLRSHTMDTAPAFAHSPPTSEQDWVQLVGHAPELALSNRSVVVVAPHPDDETLAVGGCIARLRARVVEVTIVAVTDGEASHPQVKDLAERRQREQARALRDLGVDTTPVRLGLPDTGVAGHLEDLVATLVERCNAETVLIAPWDQDGHADHDACGRAAAHAAEATGCALWSYPVWAWQWAGVDLIAAQGLHRITLDSAARAAKQRAIGRYRSQTTPVHGPPIVEPSVLARFRRPWEVVFRDH